MLATVPVRHAYVEGSAGWSKLGGGYGRLEVGAHLLPGFGAFGFGQTDQRGPMAGVGARVVLPW